MYEDRSGSMNKTWVPSPAERRSLMEDLGHRS